MLLANVFGPLGNRISSFERPKTKQHKIDYNKKCGCSNVLQC